MTFKFQSLPPEAAPQRVMIYGMNYWPEFTSTGRYCGELGADLTRRGASVEVVTTPHHYPGWYVREPFRRYWYSRDQIGKVRVFRCPLLLRRPMGGVWRFLAPLSFAISSTPIALWRLLRFRPHVILCIEPTLLAAPIAVALAKLLGARTVLHVQDLEIDVAFEVGHLDRVKWLRTAVLVFERFVHGLFDRIVTISNAMRTKLIDKGVEERRIHVIRNWVDLAKIRPLPRAGSPYRMELDIPDDTLVVEYAGNIGAKQALEVLLEAARILQSEPNLIFVIVGDGPAREGLVRRYGDLANIRFLEPQPEDRLCDLLALADLHVLPQHAGAADLVLPSKLGGMLASGRAIIVTASAEQELGEFLNGAALLTPPGDSNALAAAIAKFARTRQDPGEIARAKLVEELSSGERLDDFAKVLFDDLSRTP